MIASLGLGATLQSCSSCGDQSKPDLMHAVSQFDFKSLGQSSGGSGGSGGAGAIVGLAFQIGSKFLNVAESQSKKCDCNETTEDAGDQMLNWRVEETNSAGQILSGVSALLNGNEPKKQLEACVEEDCGAKAEGLQNNKFYRVTNILDHLLNVFERNEGNNNQVGKKNAMAKTPQQVWEEEKAFYGNNFKSELIYIDNNSRLHRVDEKTGEKTFVVQL